MPESTPYQRKLTFSQLTSASSATPLDQDRDSSLSLRLTPSTLTLSGRDSGSPPNTSLLSITSSAPPLSSLTYRSRS